MEKLYKIKHMLGEAPIPTIKISSGKILSFKILFFRQINLNLFITGAFACTSMKEMVKLDKINLILELSIEILSFLFGFENFVDKMILETPKFGVFRR